MRSGYAITIKAFLPVDTSDVPKSIEALQTLQNVQNGDVSALFSERNDTGVEIDSATFKHVNRREASD
jgi:hypothetical protein